MTNIPAMTLTEQLAELNSRFQKLMAHMADNEMEKRRVSTIDDESERRVKMFVVLGKQHLVMEGLARFGADIHSFAEHFARRN